MSKRKWTTSAAVIALALPAHAAATSPVQNQYGNPLKHETPPPKALDLGGSTTPPSGTSLPFTGLDLAAFAALGGTLAASGLVLRHVARKRRG